MEEDAVLDLWWAVPGVLAGTSVPFLHPERPHTLGATLDAFDDELPALWQAGIRATVCLLNMPGAAATYKAAGFAFLLLPIADGAAPSSEQFAEFLTFMAVQRERGHPVVVHCEAGIGRTGTLLAGYLITSGLTADAAISLVRSVRREPSRLDGKCVSWTKFSQPPTVAFSSARNGKYIPRDKPLAAR